MDFSEKVRETFARDSAARAIEYRGDWYSWGDIAAVAAALDAALESSGIGPGMPVGVVARNRVFHAASLLGLIAYGRPITMLHAFQSPEALAKDIENLRLPAIVADLQDWSEAAIDAAKSCGTVGLALTGDLAKPIERVEGLEKLRPGSHRTAPDEPTIELLTSGTTGAPKRIPIKFSVLARGVVSATLADSKSGASDRQDAPPQIMFWHFGNVGGICNLITSGVLGTPMALLEKFTVPAYVDAVKRHRPPLISLTPSAIRMILDAEVPPACFAGVKSVFGGSAPLDADTQERFEKTYGVTIYWGYGATEFCGTATRWTPEMRAEWGDRKRGSIGTAMPGVGIRAVDPATGKVLPPGEEGLLEARIPELGPDWIRTTDLVTIDSDGFAFHRGRHDGAIVRGGFKVLPETIGDVLRKHPSVIDAAVVGLPDARLGQVPAAAVEIRPGSAAPSAKELEAHVRGHLTAPHVPVKFLTMESLPRTPSMKISLTEVRRLFGESA